MSPVKTLWFPPDLHLQVRLSLKLVRPPLFFESVVWQGSSLFLSLENIAMINSIWGRAIIWKFQRNFDVCPAHIQDSSAFCLWAPWQILWMHTYTLQALLLFQRSLNFSWVFRVKCRSFALVSSQLAGTRYSCHLLSLLGDNRVRAFVFFLGFSWLWISLSRNSCRIAQPTLSWKTNNKESRSPQLIVSTRSLNLESRRLRRSRDTEAICPSHLWVTGAHLFLPAMWGVRTTNVPSCAEKWQKLWQNE